MCGLLNKFSFLNFRIVSSLTKALFIWTPKTRLGSLSSHLHTNFGLSLSVVTAAALHYFFLVSKRRTITVFSSHSLNSAAVYLLIYFLLLLCCYCVSCNFSVFGSREVRRRAPLNSRGYLQYGCLQGSKHHWSGSEYFVWEDINYSCPLHCVWWCVRMFANKQQYSL